MDRQKVENLLETLSIRKSYFLDNIRLLEEEGNQNHDYLIRFNRGIIDGIEQSMTEIRKTFLSFGSLPPVELEEDETRQCKICQKKLYQGYIDEERGVYFCGENHLNQFYGRDVKAELEAMEEEDFDNSPIFWTEWSD